MTKLTSPTDYIRALFADTGAAELRHHDGDRWRSGWFDDPIRMQNAAAEIQHRGNLFTSLNAPKPRIVANAMHGEPVCNADIGWIVRIPFDFDPVRPTGVASTADELAAANVRCAALFAMLRKASWPLPLHAMSGNGYHAQYRCMLPSNAETAEMIRIIYTGLSAEFDDDEVGFDRSVRNPDRIFRLYGSVNRKGQETPDRAHRVAYSEMPKPWRQVDARVVARLADRYVRKHARQPTASPDRSGSALHPDDEVVVASIQTIRARSAPPAGFVIIDEAHILHKAHVDLMQRWDKVPFIGFSATPLRPDLGNYFTNLVRGPTVAWLIDNDFLTPVRAFCPMQDKIDRALESLRVRAGDFIEAQLSEAFNRKELIGDIIATWKQYASDRPTLVFAVDIAHSKSIIEDFVDEGIAAARIEAYTKDGERDDIIGQFQAGEIKVLSSVNVLGIGFDVPDDGQLAEYGKPSDATGYTIEDRRQWYQAFLWQCEQRGHNPGWAFFAYQAKFDGKPPWSWRDLRPMEPTWEQHRWIRSYFIRSAKRRGAA